jgi:hypothetical protein
MDFAKTFQYGCGENPIKSLQHLIKIGDRDGGGGAPARDTNLLLGLFG